MDMHISIVYLEGDTLDVASGQREIENLGASGLIAAAPETDLLGYGCTRPDGEEWAPWVTDEVVMANYTALGSSTEMLAFLESSDGGAADRYRRYVVESARRWLDNLANLVSGADRTFESSVATRIKVEPHGTLLLAPEDLSQTSTLANVYGDIVGGAEAAFPTVASASGALPLRRCQLSIGVAPA